MNSHRAERARSLAPPRLGELPPLLLSYLGVLFLETPQILPAVFSKHRNAIASRDAL